MCGIAGIYSFNSTTDKSIVKKMTDAIAHRGPDGEGLWIDSEHKVSLGHRRLSIIDLSDDGSQPMHYLDGRYTIVFNGEIYNFIELRAGLEKKGYQFRSQSDTEVLLALYHDKKETCLDDLDGMFAFALWDNVESSLFCARDRFGEKPFYYANLNNSFYFASEMKALWAAGIQKTVKDQSLYYYLNYDCVRNPNETDGSFYEGIHMLEPGHYLKIDKEGKTTKKKYWDIDLSQQRNISIDEAKEEFMSLFTTSVSRRLRSDVTVGSSLSGGLDSSAVVMMIDQLKGAEQKQETFSARFENYSKDEGKYMQMIADASNIEPHYTWPDETKLSDNFERLCYHQEEPFGSASIFAQWEVMKLAKENDVTVLLDGQGADEIAAGYDHFIKKYYGQLYRTDKALLKSELQGFQSYYGSVFKLSLPLKLQSTMPETYDWLKNTFPAKLATKNSLLTRQFSKEHIDNNSPYKISFDLNKDMKFSSTTYGLHELLRYSDRNSMAFSREVRLPYLDHKLVSFVFSLPSTLKIHQGITKYFIREAVRGLVPDAIIDRREKVGYEPPQARWMESNSIQDIFSDSKKKLVSNGIIHAKQNKVQPNDFWKILMAGYYI